MPGGSQAAAQARDIDLRAAKAFWKIPTEGVHDFHTDGGLNSEFGIRNSGIRADAVATASGAGGVPAFARRMGRRRYVSHCAGDTRLRRIRCSADRTSPPRRSRTARVKIPYAWFRR